MEALKLEIKKLIIDISGLSQYKPDDFTDHAPLFQDGFGLDSIDVLELVVQLDKKFGLKIRNDAAGKEILQNVSSIVEAISLRRD
jgi:acyl carrier protein